MPLDSRWDPPGGNAFLPTKALPGNVAAEMGLLGAIMASPRLLDRVVDILEPEHFMEPVHGRIYKEQRRRIQAGGVADAVALQTWFSSDPDSVILGGNKYLIKLTSAMVSHLNCAEYGSVISDAWKRRQVIAASETLVDDAYGKSPDITAASTAAVDRLEAILAARAATDKQVRLGLAVDAAIEEMRRHDRGEQSKAISTGFTCIDERLGGFEPGMVYVLGGRPGMGKSALGHAISLNAARNGIEVLELSLEMSATQLGRRALSAASGLPIMAIKRGKLNQQDEQSLLQARAELTNLPLTIDDAAGQSASQIAAKARIAKRRDNVGLIMVDHLNLMRPENEDAKHGGTWSIERASGTMLQVAKDCECPVLLLAQLNRGVEGREDKRPSLSDLRQAGAIEQDAYAVGFVYREEYYLQGEPTKKDGETPSKYLERQNAWTARQASSRGKVELIWAKVRDGEPGIDRLTFDGPTASFGEV